MVNHPFCQQEFDFTIDQKNHFLSTHINFYYTITKCRCLHLQNILFLEKFFGQLAFFFWSIMMPPIKIKVLKFSSKQFLRFYLPKFTRQLSCLSHLCIIVLFIRKVDFEIWDPIRRFCRFLPRIFRCSAFCKENWKHLKLSTSTESL